MQANQLLLFFFSALGAFNGLLLGVYFLFFTKKRHLTHIYLGGLLFALSIRIGKSVFYYFNPDLAMIYLQIGLSACFMIGPFLFLYSHASVSRKPNPRLGMYMLSVLFVIIVWVGVFYPYKTNLILWRWYMIRVIMYLWLAFILGSAFLLRGTLYKLCTRPRALYYEEVWRLSVFLGVFAIWLAYFTSFITSYIVGALSFSFVLYLSISVLISLWGKIPLTTPEEKPKYANKKIEEAEAQSLLSRVDVLMQEKELYKDPNLTLSGLAKRVQVSPHYLSQLLNDNLNKRFSEFVNAYRIENAKKMLKEEQNLKMEIIAENCGFNSNSTFYAAFKKFTNTTPAKYMSQE